MEDKKVHILLSKRWILAYIGFWGFFFIYATRVNMSVAIVCMVKDDPDKMEDSDNDTSSTCTLDTSESNKTKEGEFDWDKTTQSFVLSSFFYGYIVLQIPGGWLSSRYGGRRVLGIGIFITAVATLLIPVAARWHYQAVFALRAIIGIAQSVSFPCMHTMWGRWAPLMERTRLASFTYAGLNIGNILTLIGSGLLCEYGFDNGWASIFYITGGGALVWVLLWFWITSDTPDEHPTITEAEKKYILQGLGESQEKKFIVPWRSLITSRANLICLTAHFCNNWMHYTLLTGLPTFMKEVLKFDIKKNGLLSSVPYMVMVFSTIGAGQLADFIRRRYLSTTYTRRLFQGSSFIFSGSLIVVVGFVNCEHRMIAVVLLAIAVGFEGLCYAGYMVNQVDFAPRYAGILYGMNNFISTIPGILAPTVTGALTTNQTQEEWKQVFYICGAFTALGAIAFGGFASGELEPWAVDNRDAYELSVTDTKNSDKTVETKEYSETKTKL